MHAGAVGMHPRAAGTHPGAAGTHENLTGIHADRPGPHAGAAGVHENPTAMPAHPAAAHARAPAIEATRPPVHVRPAAAAPPEPWARFAVVIMGNVALTSDDGARCNVSTLPEMRSTLIGACAGILVCYADRAIQRPWLTETTSRPSRSTRSPNSGGTEIRSFAPRGWKWSRISWRIGLRPGQLESFSGTRWMVANSWPTAWSIRFVRPCCTYRPT